MIYLIKFHVSNSNDSVVIAIKPNKNIRTATT
jgi:hypothetical protein